MNELTTLNQLVSEIKFFENQATLNYWEMGKRLVQAKEKVEHGRWQTWIEGNFKFSYSTANRLINIYEENPNLASMRSLPIGHEILLLGIDKEKRQEFVETNDVEGMTQKELRQAIQENKKLKEQLDHQEPIIKEVVKEVIHPLYEKTKNDKELLELQLKEKENENQRLLKKIEYEKNNSDIKQIMLDQYQITQQSIDKLKREKNGFVEQLKAMEHLATLKKRLEKVFTTELLPVNYIMDIKLNHGSQEIMESLDEALKVVEKWCSDMRKYLPNTRIKGDYIDV